MCGVRAYIFIYAALPARRTPHAARRTVKVLKLYIERRIQEFTIGESGNVKTMNRFLDGGVYIMSTVKVVFTTNEIMHGDHQ